MKNIKGTLFTIGMATTLISCSGHYKRPESITKKMKRYQSHTGNQNRVAHFELNPKWSYSRGRRLASIIQSDAIPYTNKNLYFLSLYSQYQQLSSLKGLVPQEPMTSCPSFHSSLLKHNKKYKAHSSPQDYKEPKLTSLDQLKNPNFVAQYPLLALPMTKNSLKPTVQDYLLGHSLTEAPGIFKKALSVHLLKSRKEIDELCSYGVSDNYYAYENLMTYSAQRDLAKGQVSATILLKTTLYSNLYLMDSLELPSMPSIVRPQGRSLASKAPSYYSEISQRLGVQWVRNFIHF